jgi:di/tricarboxylate transporter
MPSKRALQNLGAILLLIALLLAELEGFPILAIIAIVALAAVVRDFVKLLRRHRGNNDGPPGAP